VPRRLFRATRKLRFTREGKYFVVLSLGIGFAAINTGNNLLFLVLGMMLVLIVASGVLSELSLRALSVERRSPDRIFARRPFLMEIGLTNEKRRVPSFSIEIEDLLAGASLERTCYFLKLPAGKRQRTSYRTSFPRRGLYRFSGFNVSTKFPFAFFRKTRPVESPAEVVVFPAIHPVSSRQLASGHAGERTSGRLDRRGDFHALREYQQGDDPRAIHWRKSARAGRMMIRQNEEQEARRIAIFFDNRRRGGSPAELELQEEAVCQVASLAAHYIERSYAVQLVARGVSVAPGRGQRHLNRLLRALALLDFTTEDQPLSAPTTWTGDQLHVGPTGSVSSHHALL